MKFLSIFLLLSLLAGSAVALPSYSGLRGLNRTVDARTADTGLLSIGLFSFLGISPDERKAILQSEEVEVTDVEYSGTGYITLGYGINDHFELGTRVSYLLNQIKRENVNNRLNTSGDWNGDDGFSEAGLFLKYTFNPQAEKIWYGFMPWAQFSIYNGGDNNFVYNGDEWDGIWNTDQPMFQMRRPMMNSGDFSFGADFLTTVKLDAVTIHGNLGYHYYKQDFVFTDNRYDALHFVIASEDLNIEVTDPVLSFVTGIEYPMNKATLFAELEWRHFLNREFEEGDGQRFDDCIQIIPGARFAFDSGFAMDVTGSYAISSFDPEYNDMGHRYYQQDISQTDEERARYAPFPGGYAPKYGVGVNLMYSANVLPNPSILTGTVTDAASGDNVNATISFPGSDVDNVNSTSGVYTVQLEQGTYTILVVADGYIPVSETVEITSGENLTKDFALHTVMGTVVGTVTDAGNGIGLEALVAVSASEKTTTDLGGEYSIERPAGTITLLVSADGYANQSRTVEIISGESVVQDIQLSIELSFENVYFDVASFIIRPDAEQILNRVAQMLISNPGVSVMITGNTDSDGSPEYNQELAGNRAEAVRAYLISRGVSEQSLSTVGYGEERPVAPNSSDENKALNRRSEFTILAAPIQ